MDNEGPTMGENPNEEDDIFSADFIDYVANLATGTATFSFPSGFEGIVDTMLQFQNTPESCLSVQSLHMHVSTDITADSSILAPPPAPGKEGSVDDVEMQKKEEVHLSPGETSTVRTTATGKGKEKCVADDGKVGNGGSKKIVLGGSNKDEKTTGKRGVPRKRGDVHPPPDETSKGRSIGRQIGKEKRVADDGAVVTDSGTQKGVSGSTKDEKTTGKERVSRKTEDIPESLIGRRVGDEKLKRKFPVQHNFVKVLVKPETPDTDGTTIWYKLNQDGDFYGMYTRFTDDLHCNVEDIFFTVEGWRLSGMRTLPVRKEDLVSDVKPVHGSVFYLYAKDGTRNVDPCLIELNCSWDRVGKRKVRKKLKFPPNTDLVDVKEEWCHFIQRPPTITVMSVNGIYHGDRGGLTLSDVEATNGTVVRASSLDYRDHPSIARRLRCVCPCKCKAFNP